MSNIIQINNLNKSFGSVNAVQNLSFRVKKGELFAFLGVNGAGKSTTISWYQWGRKINYNQYYVRTTIERQWKRFY